MRTMPTPYEIAALTLARLALSGGGMVTSYDIEGVCDRLHRERNCYVDQVYRDIALEIAQLLS